MGDRRTHQPDDRRADLRPDRHVVAGSGGTAIVAPCAVVLIEAPADAPVVRAVEADLFGPAASDPIARLTDTEASFAAAIATDRGIELVVGGRARIVTDPEGVEIGDGLLAHSVTARLVLDDGGVGGQWVTSGVVAAGSVTVGALRPSRRPVAAARGGGHDGAAAAVELGNLVPGHRGPAPPGPTGQDLERTAETAPFSPSAVTYAIRVDDGTIVPLDAPVLIGRRPPEESIGGSAPRRVLRDDTMLSRHHASVRFVDGRVVVVDEGSTNGTTLTSPAGATQACPPHQPVVLPVGGTIDLGGALTATLEGPPSTC